MGEFSECSAENVPTANPMEDYKSPWLTHKHTQIDRHTNTHRQLETCNINVSSS